MPVNRNAKRILAKGDRTYGAKEIIKILVKRFNLKVGVKQLEKEIEGVEKELIKRTAEFSKLQKNAAFGKLKSRGDVNYIG